MKQVDCPIVRRLNDFMNYRKIDILKYNLKSPEWWQGQLAMLTKRYTNISEEVIEKEAFVCILFPMQYIRHNVVIHNGAFFIKDVNSDICIGGVSYKYLVFYGQKAKVGKDWLISF